MNKLTFIIVTWNNENCIIDCLDSIYKYCNNFKIIVVDNNSSDQTVKIIRSKKYKNLVLFDLKENSGFAKGNNYALKYVDTQYICYLNPDTVLTEDIIEPSIMILEKNSDIGIVGCKLVYKNLKKQASCYKFISPNQIIIESFRFGKIFPNFLKEIFFPHESDNKKSKYIDWIIGAEMILSLEDAIRINGFSEEYYMYTEDMDLCMKMKKICMKKTFFNSKNKLIHIGGASESKNINYSKMQKIIKNKVLFSSKFYGKKKTEKIIKAMIFTYRIRLFLLSILIIDIKKIKSKNIQKMKRGLEYSIEEYNLIKGE